MNTKDEAFFKRLRATFRIEAEEHIRAISAGLIELEKPSAPERHTEIIETVFREAHSLKGAARSVNLSEIESLCQPLEGAFASLKRSEIVLSPTLCDLFHQVVNAIAQLVSSTDEKSTPANSTHARELIRQLNQASAGIAPSIKPKETRPDTDIPSAQSTLPTDKMIPPIPPIEEKPLIAGTVRISTARLDALLRQAEEMVSVKIAATQRTAEAQKVKL